VKLIITITLDR